ncbi:hypothetical protein M514_02232 [Trichuris suis]|uniref:Uncharacterized protein n=1 Tax=Trichuris suis TaxID=68888 RepID=A0A085MIC9_9BILA|nr:hypothetical protein M513_02232 [Trichuris suis]KFD70080.1 hypothetical protein M514_02232 [Trichuris suis]
MSLRFSLKAGTVHRLTIQEHYPYFCLSGGLRPHDCFQKHTIKLHAMREADYARSSLPANQRARNWPIRIGGADYPDLGKH